MEIWVFVHQCCHPEAATALLRAAEDGRLASALAPKELEQMRQAGNYHQTPGKMRGLDGSYDVLCG